MGQCHGWYVRASDKEAVSDQDIARGEVKWANRQEGMGLVGQVQGTGWDTTFPDALLSPVTSDNRMQSS